MEPIRLPGDEEIIATCDQRKAAVITLFRETVGRLAERVQKIAATAGSHPPLMGSRKRRKGYSNAVGRKAVGMLMAHPHASDQTQIGCIYKWLSSVTTAVALLAQNSQPSPAVKHNWPNNWVKRVLRLNAAT